MDAKTFDQVVAFRLIACKNMLKARKSTYAPEEDRLANFKTAAAFQNITSEAALLGMMSKHLTAISDFVRTQKFGKEDLPQWEEKITDSINYLLLLEALVREELL